MSSPVLDSYDTFSRILGTKLLNILALGLLFFSLGRAKAILKANKNGIRPVASERVEGMCSLPSSGTANPAFWKVGGTKSQWSGWVIRY